MRRVHQGARHAQPHRAARSRRVSQQPLENRLRLARCPSWAGQQINRRLAWRYEGEAAVLPRPLKDHLVETKGQIKTLQAVFKSIGKKASGEKCDAIEGLLKETDGAIGEAKGAVARHAVIIGCCQAVEHYEIARYGTLREWAKALGEAKAHELLSEILDQEKAANFKLTNIAITEINKPGK